MSNLRLPSSRILTRTAPADPTRMQPDTIVGSNPITGAEKSLKQVTNELYNQNVPPQIRQVAFSCILTTLGQPVMLIPSNIRRMSFIVANPDPNFIIGFSYGQPVGNQGGAVAVIPMGIPVNPMSFYQETNGTVSIDDIFVFVVNIPLVGALPISILGYEGTLSIEGRYNG